MANPPIGLSVSLFNSFNDSVTRLAPQQLIKYASQDKSGTASNISAENDHWASASVIDEKTYTDEVSKWIDEGATILAGCCRTRPSHIKEMTERLGKK